VTSRKHKEGLREKRDAGGRGADQRCLLRKKKETKDRGPTGEKSRHSSQEHPEPSTSKEKEGKEKDYESVSQTSAHGLMFLTSQELGIISPFGLAHRRGTSLERRKKTPTGGGKEEATKIRRWAKGKKGNSNTFDLVRIIQQSDPRNTLITGAKREGRDGRSTKRSGRVIKRGDQQPAKKEVKQGLLVRT